MLNNKYTKFEYKGMKTEVTDYTIYAPKQCCGQTDGLSGPNSEKQVSTIRKYYNHTLQTYPKHRLDEPHNNRKTPGRQTN